MAYIVKCDFCNNESYPNILCFNKAHDFYELSPNRFMGNYKDERKSYEICSECAKRAIEMLEKNNHEKIKIDNGTDFFVNAKNEGNNEYSFVIDDMLDNPDWFEPVEDRIELKYEETITGREAIVKVNGDNFTCDESMIMNKAINGESFTKEDMFSYTHKYMNMLPHNTHEDVFKAWLKSKP